MPRQTEPARRDPVVMLPADAPVEDIVALANQQRKEKRWRAAEALYERVMRDHAGTDAAAIATVASASLHLDHLADPAGALRRFRRALRLRPDGPLAEEARWGLAETYRALGDVEAERAALRALPVGPPALGQRGARAPATDRARGRAMRRRALPSLLVAVARRPLARRRVHDARHRRHQRRASTTSLETYCDGGGPPVLVDGTCTGELAEELFRHAVCGCGGLDFNGDLVADGFDSRDRAVWPRRRGGDVASNVGLERQRLDGHRRQRRRSAGPRACEAGELLRRGRRSDLGRLARPTRAAPSRWRGRRWIGGDVMVGSLTVSGR